MGGACSEEKYESFDRNMDSKQPDSKLSKHRTVRGIETMDDVRGYQVGSGISALTQSVLSQMSGDEDPLRYAPIFIKHKGYYYFWATIAYICNADGVLHEKEKSFIKFQCTEVGLKDDETNDLLTNFRDYSKEYVIASENSWKEFDPTLDKKGLNKKLLMAREYLVLYTLMAAAQDGLHEDEYKVAKHMAEKLKFR